jgi:uncharacterized C2H2 Zn-finger protein
MSTNASSKVADVGSRDLEPFRCERCGVPFTTGQDLRRHIQLTHKRGEIEAKEKPSAPSTRSKKSKHKSGKSAETKATKTKSKTTRKVAPTRKTTTRTRRK